MISSRYKLCLVAARAILLAVLSFHGTSGVAMSFPEPQNKTAARDEKESRSAAQQKIDSQLLYALRQKHGEAGKNGVPLLPIKLRTDPQGRVQVDIRAIVSQQLNSRIEKLGGKVVSTGERLESTIAFMPLESMEDLASCSQVKSIIPAAESATH
jgi:hypothetical protein